MVERKVVKWAESSAESSAASKAAMLEKQRAVMTADQLDSWVRMKVGKMVAPKAEQMAAWSAVWLATMLVGKLAVLLADD